MCRSTSWAARATRPSEAGSGAWHRMRCQASVRFPTALCIVLRYDCAVMFEVVVAALVAVSGMAVLASAVALIGAVLSLGRADHRNPVAYRWIAWHDRHSALRH